MTAVERGVNVTSTPLCICFGRCMCKVGLIYLYLMNSFVLFRRSKDTDDSAAKRSSSST